MRFAASVAALDLDPVCARRAACQDPRPSACGAFLPESQKQKALRQRPESR
jgi:hypothetical protein